MGDRDRRPASSGLDRLRIPRPREGSETAVWTGVFVLVLAAAVVALLVVFGGPGSQHPDRVPPGSVASGTPSGPLDAGGVWNPYLTVRGGGAAASAASRRLWEPVAQQFVQGFLAAAHDSGWLARMRPLVSPQLLGRLRWVRRSEIARGAPTGMTLRASGDHIADVTVRVAGAGHLDALGVELVDLPHDGRGWMVYGYQDRSE